MTPLHPLSWYTLLFILPVVTGIVLCVGSLLVAGYDHDADFDADHDFDASHDANHDAHHHGGIGGAVAWLLYAIGSGSVPTGFAVSLSFLLFGTTGLLTIVALGGALPPWVVVPLAVLAALAVVLVLGRRICLLLARWFPTYEHHSVTPHTLVGAAGVATTDLDDKVGYVGVTDDKGSYHVLTARALEGPIRKGERIVVGGYDRETGVHAVVREPQ